MTINHSQATSDTETTDVDINRDVATIEAIHEIVCTRMNDEPYWGDIVLDVLRSYNDRGKRLPDWWVWTRFYATFGYNGPGVSYNTWLASDTLDHLLTASRAFAAYEAGSWFKRWRQRRIYRIAQKTFNVLLAQLVRNEASWCDRHDFLKYKNSLNG